MTQNNYSYLVKNGILLNETNAQKIHGDTACRNHLNAAN